MPTISVIVPVYNVEKYIHRCVDSILAQTFTDFELILVDDGSPDNCGVICDEYAKKDSRVVVIHQQNGGLSAARNAGLSVATGEYLFFVDSDDVIHPDSLRILWDCAQTTCAEISAGLFTRFSGDTSPTDQFNPWNGTYSTATGLETLYRFFEDPANLPAIVSACGKLWHRDLFHNTTFPAGRLFEDEFVTYRLYHKAHLVAFADATLYFYFVNENGITRTLTTEKRFDEYDAQWERLLYFGKHKLCDLQKKAVMTFLQTAQWDLITCRKNLEPVSVWKKERLEANYKSAFLLARKAGWLNFIDHYDYFVLALPKRQIFLRIKRQIYLLLQKKD